MLFFTQNGEPQRYSWELRRRTSLCYFSSKMVNLSDIAGNAEEELVLFLHRRMYGCGNTRRLAAPPGYTTTGRPQTSSWKGTVNGSATGNRPAPYSEDCGRTTWVESIAVPSAGRVGCTRSWLPPCLSAWAPPPLVSWVGLVACLLKGVTAHTARRVGEGGGRGGAVLDLTVVIIYGGGG